MIQYDGVTEPTSVTTGNIQTIVQLTERNRFRID